MKLISEIDIDHFRSIRNESITQIGDFTAFAGPNNSGKSNILRALNAFFNDQTDTGTPVEFSRDYYCHDLKSKKAKRFSIAVTFELPSSFKFRAGLGELESLLGRSFKIRKQWLRDVPTPQFYLNTSSTPLMPEHRDQVQQFLSLVSFRYIPNRVLPLDIIRDEHRALRDVLIRRLAKRAKGEKSVFKAIGNTSQALIKSLQSAIHQACPDIGSIRLATPLSWQDLIFAFGYKLRMQESELDDTVQGSGIQSLLMFETLSLIDRDYFQKFGWRQAAIWAVEEPESSLHTLLEARVSAYLSKIASDPKGRLQILCTTHSDLMLQSANSSYFVSMQDGKSVPEVCDKKAALEKAARLGISRWTHPILHYPLNTIVLVEGKYDCGFLEQALKLLAPQKTVLVTYLELLQGSDTKGGIDEMLKYVKSNYNAIRVRIKEAPLIILLDWDSSKKKEDFEKVARDGIPYKVFSWPDSSCNPKLGKAFHGIERHFPDRIIAAADSVLDVVGTKRDHTRTVNRDDYGKLKEEAFKVVQKGITVADLVHAKPFLEDLLRSIP